MKIASTLPWEKKRTDESRQVEAALLDAGFEQADAYRYNSASIRVRVIDSKFEKLPVEKRDAKVEKILRKLPESIQADIVYLLTIAPSELEDKPDTLKYRFMNRDFEHPLRSRL